MFKAHCEDCSAFDLDIIRYGQGRPPCIEYFSFFFFHFFVSCIISTLWIPSFAYFGPFSCLTAHKTKNTFNLFDVNLTSKNIKRETNVLLPRWLLLSLHQRLAYMGTQSTHESLHEHSCGRNMSSALRRNDRLVLLVPATMAMCYFLLLVGEGFCTRTLQKCQALDENTSIIARIDCIKSIVDYVLVTVAIFAGTYMIASFLRERTRVPGHEQRRTNLGHIKSGEVKLAESSDTKSSSILKDGSKDHLS